MLHSIKGLIVGIITGLIGAVLALTPIGADFEKHVGLAWLFNTRGAIESPKNLAVVAINEHAIEGLGLPALPRDWQRSIHGQLVDKLVERGASVIIFDMDFQRPKIAQEDLEFAQSIARADRVVLFQRLNGRSEPIYDMSGKQSGSIWTEQLVLPIPVFVDSAKGLAPFPLPKVQVNVFQFWTFKPSAGDVATMPGAALQVFSMGLYDQWIDLLQAINPDSVANLPARASEIKNAKQMQDTMRVLRRVFVSDSLLLGKIEQALVADNDEHFNSKQSDLILSLSKYYAGTDNRYINFYGPPGQISTIPFNAVITGYGHGITAEDLDFTNKVVFVGFSDLYDPGQPDRFYTVFTNENGVDLSGVEIAATAFGNLLTDSSIKLISTNRTFIGLLVFGLILGAGIFLLPALVGVPLAIGLTLLYVYLAQFVFSNSNTWLPLAIPALVQFPLALFAGLLGQYLLERKRKQHFSRAASYYLPEQAMKDLNNSHLDHDSMNKVVYGACFATDMSGFTTISQSMPPDQLAVFMNTYFDTLAQALKRHQVDVTEFHADTIMCAWTSKTPEQLDRNNAALAGLAVVDAVSEFNAVTENVSLNPRIGIDEGSFYLGHTGGGGRMGYSILGDCANTAARIEGLNKFLGTHVLATNPVVEKLDNLLLRPVGQFVLVGKIEPSSIVEVVAEKSMAEDNQKLLCEKFAIGFKLYTEQNWQAAASAFDKILQIYEDDGPSLFYAKRCHEYEVKEPESDDPCVIYMDSK